MRLDWEDFFLIVPAISPKEVITMGGINCGGGGNVSPEFSAEYIEQLASYCKSLFDGSAKLFEANVAIEDAVMTGGGLVAAMQLLSSSEDALTSARATLNTVAGALVVRLHA